MKARPVGVPLRVLIVLTYYRPHVSGLTIYADRLARELASRGHQVSVLTSRYDHSLPKEELVDGVRIIRVPVFARVSKGVLMPIMLWALRQARRHDAVSIHLPQFDGAAVAVAARLMRRPTVLTYHCDLRLPKGLINRTADAVVFAMNYIAGLLAHRIVAYTQDYANHSPLLRRFPRKIRVVPPPVIMPAAGAEEVVAFRQRVGLGAGPIVGSAARFATEKGLEYLIDAVTILQHEHPDIQVLFAGQYVDVVGEADYWAMLQPKIQALGDCWRFLGVLQPDEMPAFYGAVDVLVVSSVNSTESFGLVQVEAMLDGTPVVATALPGVRQPVAMTGMGVVVPPRDARALADGVAEVLASGDRYVRARHEIEALFDISATVNAYEQLFTELLPRRRPQAVADHLTQHLATMAPHRALLRSVECRLMGAVPISGAEHQPVLDIGCGDGHFASIAYEHPIDVGIDLRRDELVEAASRGRGVYRTGALASPTELPLATGSFRTVLSNCAIEHIADNDAVLAEIARVLQPRGSFATTLPSEHFGDMLLGSTVLRTLGTSRLGAAYGRFFNRISYHFHVHDPAEWQARLEAVGLRVVDHQYYFSPQAHRVFDSLHYLGVPNLLARKLTGRWVLHPATTRPYERWLRRYYEEPLPQPVGAYQYVRCIRTDP
ncbi:MAG: glycosyltransferase [Mycetocola sp.]